MYKWLLFDADNTLFDFSLAEKKAFKATFDLEKLPYSDERFDQYKTINKVVWDEFEQGSLTPDEVKVVRFERLFHVMNVKRDPKSFGMAFTDQLGLCTDLVEGAEPLLTQLAPYFNMGIITNGLKKVQRSRFSLSTIHSYFDPIIISEEVGYKKPELGIFDLAFSAMGQPPKAEVLMIGDSLSSDMLGGINYGIDTCWFNPSGRSNPEQLKLTYEIQALDQLPNLLAQEETI